MEKLSPADEQRLAFTAEEDAKCLKMLQLMAESLEPAQHVMTVPGSLTREDLANACRLVPEGMVDYVRRRQQEDSFLFHNGLLPLKHLAPDGLIPIKPLGETDGKA